MLEREILDLVHLLDRGLHPPIRTRAHDRHAVLAARSHLLEFGRAVDAGLGAGLQLRDHAVFFLRHVGFQVGGGDLEAEFRLQRHEHAAEVLPHEVFDQFGAGVAFGDVESGQDFVGQVGAGFEGEFFREDEGVVAVEEEVSDLLRVSKKRSVIDAFHQSEEPCHRP